jgi:hypothetical protein
MKMEEFEGFDELAEGGGRICVDDGENVLSRKWSTTPREMRRIGDNEDTERCNEDGEVDGLVEIIRRGIGD